MKSDILKCQIMSVVFALFCFLLFNAEQTFRYFVITGIFCLFTNSPDHHPRDMPFPGYNPIVSGFTVYCAKPGVHNE